jgi:formylglycine-generating enzyme required for sulfatase activity
MIDETKLENISERLVTIEKLLEDFLSRNSQPGNSYQSRFAQTNPLGFILDLIHNKVLENRGESKSDRPVSTDELKKLLENGELSSSGNLIRNMNYLQKVQGDGIEPLKANTSLDSIQNALLHVLVWYLEDKNRDVTGRIGSTAYEKQYRDFVKMALSDGIISIEDRRLLDDKSQELNLTFQQAQRIEKELMIQGRKNLNSVTLDSLEHAKESSLNRREFRIIEEALDTIYNKNNPLEVLEDIELLLKKYPNSKKISETYYIILKEKDPSETLKNLESIKEKSSIEHRILIDILAEMNRFNDAYDELEDMNNKFPNESGMLRSIEAYILYLEWKKFAKHKLIEDASKMLMGSKANNGYESYVKHLISLAKGSIKLENISSSLELFYRAKLYDTQKQTTSEFSVLKPLQIQNFKHAVNSIGMEFILLPPGEFLMGALEYDTKADHTEKPIHTCKINTHFYIAKFPTTQENWEKIMEKNPSKFIDSGKNAPVESITWDEVQIFIKKLNEKEGLISEKGYRLPTEAEWEYACRAGGNSIFYFGDDSGTALEFAWCEKNSESKTHPVGQKKPNSWGLYDMVGNVWEWCQDWYTEYASPETKTISRKVRRGGSWMDSESSLRSSERGSDRTTFQYSDLGFRIVCSAENLFQLNKS